MIVDHALDFYRIEFTELAKFAREVEAEGKSAERVSVSQALKHFARDWAEDGEHERIATFPQILETLQESFPNRTEENPVRVLVPGAGVGRLAHDIADLGGEISFESILSGISYTDQTYTTRIRSNSQRMVLLHEHRLSLPHLSTFHNPSLNHHAPLHRLVVPSAKHIRAPARNLIPRRPYQPTLRKSRRRGLHNGIPTKGRREQFRCRSNSILHRHGPKSRFIS